ncbi:MAG: pyridoxal phosphate-dependent aminotransferase [Proteobacteria bacterium]|nr:pyridoxal phosphate-dependent aminotransferase [Pseudomonadota bacterium]
MNFKRMPIEIESPEQMGYASIKYNLTESSYSDQDLSKFNFDIKDLLLCYGDHVGHPGLRKLIAEDAGLKAEHILLTPGAAGALFFIATSLLKAGDHILVEHPNYATNIETPRSIGAEVEFIPLKIENSFAPNLEWILSRIKKNTKLVSLTFPHNPTGTQVSEAEFKNIVKSITDRGVYLLVDETYRDMAFEAKLPVAATLSDKAISVSSLSKTYGLPGLRMGWMMSQDAALQEKCLAAKEQIVITGSIVDEELSYRFYRDRSRWLPEIKKDILAKRKIYNDWLTSETRMEGVTPVAGVVGFPRIKNISQDKIEVFYKTLNNEFGTFVGPGHWFEIDKCYMRIGYGWPSLPDLKTGLMTISQALDITLK